MFEPFESEARFALQAVQCAAQLARLIQQEMAADSLMKEDRSPVTVADFASQAIIARRLEQAFPGDPLMAEEGSQALRQPHGRQILDSVTRYVSRIFPKATSAEICQWIDYGSADSADRFWTLDPIDGTKGFLRGGQFVVALALLEGGQVVLGALGCPNLNSLMQPDPAGQGRALIAVRGGGAWAASLTDSAFNRLRVSTQSQRRQARLLRSFEAQHTDVGKLSQFAHLMGIERPPILMDSQAKFAVLAAGGAELILRLVTPHRPDYCENIWDQAAGSLIVEQAGGRVSDLLGKPLDFSAGRRLRHNIGVLVSNGKLHQPALNILHSIGADRRPSAE